MGGDFNDLVISDMGGFGIGQINDGWVRLLDCAVGKGL